MSCFVGLDDEDISTCYVHLYAKIIKQNVSQTLLQDSAKFCFQL